MFPVEIQTFFSWIVLPTICFCFTFCILRVFWEVKVDHFKQLLDPVKFHFNKKNQQAKTFIYKDIAKLILLQTPGTHGILHNEFDLIRSTA